MESYINLKVVQEKVYSSLKIRADKLRSSLTLIGEETQTTEDLPQPIARSFGEIL